LALLFALFTTLGIFLLYPIALTVRGGLIDDAGGEATFTLDHVASVFTTPRLRDGLVNSFLIACATTLLATLIALPLAGLSARRAFPGKTLLGAFVLVPLILPPFVGAIGVHHILGRAGALNSLLIDLGWIDQGIDFIGRGGFWAVVVVEALHLYPIVYLNAAAALAGVDPAMEEAAENLGASRWTRFRTITLPMIRPGLFAGATIVFVWSFTELGTPLMFEYHQVTPVQILSGIREMNASAQPYALTIVMLFAAMAAYVFGRAALGRRSPALHAKASRGVAARRMGPLGSLAAITCFAGVALVAALPHLGLILASVSVESTWYRTILPPTFTTDHFVDALGHPLAIGSIRNSLFLAAAAVLIDVVIGVAIAHLVVRTRVPLRGALDALAMLPLAVPGLVMAFGFVAMTLEWPFRPGDPLAGWIDVIGANPNPVPLLIIAYAIRRLPYVVRAAAAGLEQTSTDLEEASLNLGASRARTFARITAPLIAANLIAGAMLAFSFAMLEVSDSLVLAQREEHFPITKAIYVLFQRLGDGAAIAGAMGVWAMALLALALLGATMLMGRRLGAAFRA